MSLLWKVLIYLKVKLFTFVKVPNFDKGFFIRKPVGEFCKHPVQYHHTQGRIQFAPTMKPNTIETLLTLLKKIIIFARFL